MKSILILSLFSLNAFAGGSISFQEEVKPLLEAVHSAEVFRLLESVEIEDTGEATRLGRQTTLAGARVCPCVFAVQTKGPLTITGRLEVRTRWEALDGRGRVVDVMDPSASSIRQEFTGMSLELDQP